MTTVKESNITIEDLEEMLLEALEELEAGDIWEKLTEGVTFNSRLKSTGAQAKMHRNAITGQIVNYSGVEVNPAVKVQEIEDVMRHEALHLATGLGDTNPEFKRMAKAHSIPLQLEHSLKSTEDYKYLIKCEGCGETLKHYQRKGKYIKHIEAGGDGLYCPYCDSDELSVEYLE